MFSPEIAKRCSYVLNTEVEKELAMMFDDLISQTIAKMKSDSPDIELRISAVKVDLLTKLKDYRNHLGDSIKRHGSR